MIFGLSSHINTQGYLANIERKLSPYSETSIVIAIRDLQYGEKLVSLHNDSLHKPSHNPEINTKIWLPPHVKASIMIKI